MDVMQIVGAASSPSTISNAKHEITIEEIAGRGAGWLGGLAAGAFLWKKHRVLGAFAGSQVGSSIYPLIKGDTRDRIGVAFGFGREVLACASSLHFKKHPVWGYIGGSAIGFAGEIGVGLALFTKKK